MFYSLAKTQPHTPSWNRQSLNSVFDSFFDSFFYKGDYQRPRVGTTSVEEVDENTSVIKMEIPGYGKEDFEIEYFKDRQELAIRSKMEDMKIDKVWRLHKHTASVEAKADKGLLTITLKKEVPEELKPEIIMIS